MTDRDPRQRDRVYLGWIAKLPCVACMVRGDVRWGVQVAHLRAGSLEHGKRHTGKAEKPSDRWTLPLCQPHHTGDSRRVAFSQHGMDEEEFWAKLGIDPFQLCLDLRRAYEADRAGAGVISLAAARGRRIIEGAPIVTEDDTRRWYAGKQADGSLPSVAISIQQPWAWLVVNGLKGIENRTWLRKTPPRSLVHAGKEFDHETFDDLQNSRHPVTGERLTKVVHEAFLDALEKSQVHTGGFVGVVDFTGVVLEPSKVPDIKPYPWLVGPYGYCMTNAKPLPFLPWRGMLGFFPAKVAA